MLVHLSDPCTCIFFFFESWHLKCDPIVLSAILCRFITLIRPTQDFLCVILFPGPCPIFCCLQDSTANNRKLGECRNEAIAFSFWSAYYIVMLRSSLKTANTSRHLIFSFSDCVYFPIRVCTMEILVTERV